MFEVLKQFYTIHYNFGALAILLLMLLIFLLTKKNLRVAVIVLAALIAMNVFIYKRTEGKVWTITIDPPTQTDSYGNTAYAEPTVYKFSALKNWTITDENGKVLHWCWLDELWDGFANTDLVAAAWGENASKKMMKSTEERASGNE